MNLHDAGEYSIMLRSVRTWCGAVVDHMRRYRQAGEAIWL